MTRLLLCEVDAKNRCILAIDETVLKVEVLADILVIGHGASRETYDPAHLVIDRYSIAVSQHRKHATFTSAYKTNLLQDIEVQAFVLGPGNEAFYRCITDAKSTDGIHAPSLANSLTSLDGSGIDLLNALCEVALRIAESYAQGLLLLLLLLFLLAWSPLVLNLLVEIFLCEFLAGNRERKSILQLAVEADDVAA